MLEGKEVSTIINLYGGPGTGKSTSAAELFALLKRKGKNAELVREYVKKWAWQERKIEVFDQTYFLGKQSQEESKLYGRVDYIVTDSPVFLSGIYATEAIPLKYDANDTASVAQYLALKQMSEATWGQVRAFYKLGEAMGHKHVHVMLKRTKKYQPKGRFQTADEAKALDNKIEDYLAIMFGGRVLHSGTGPTDLQNLLKTILKDK